MKRLLLLSILGILTISTLFAQENTILWKISGKDLKADSYLLGTIHMLCEENFHMPEKIKTAAKESDQVIFEVNLFDPAVMAKAQELIMKPNPDFFKDYDPNKIKLIDSVLTANQLSIKMFDMVSPSTLISLLALKSFDCQDPTKIKSVENEIFGLMQGKKTGEFETLEFQMDLLSKLATPDYYYNYLKNLDKYTPIAKNLSKVYLNEDLSALKNMFENTDYMSQKEYDIMLTDRNIKWVEELPAKIQNTKTLIAVGAGHLVGEKGLIKLLQDKGYTLTPIK